MSTTRQFGIITNVAGMQAGICVNSLNIDQNVETAEARDSQGKITDLAAFSKSRSISVSGVMDTANGTLATAGSMLTIGGDNYLIESVSKSETNTDFVQVTINGRTADGANIITYSNSTLSSNSNL